MGNANDKRIAKINDPYYYYNPRQLEYGNLYQERDAASLRDPSLILWPYLFLGSNAPNKNPNILRQLGITHVLNMAYECDPSIELLSDRNINYKHIPADDTPNYNIRFNFEEAFAFIDDAVASGGKVFGKFLSYLIFSNIHKVIILELRSSLYDGY